MYKFLCFKTNEILSLFFFFNTRPPLLHFLVYITLPDHCLQEMPISRRWIGQSTKRIMKTRMTLCQSTDGGLVNDETQIVTIKKFGITRKRFENSILRRKRKLVQAVFPWARIWVELVIFNRVMPFSIDGLFRQMKKDEGKMGEPRVYKSREICKKKKTRSSIRKH